MTQAPSEPPFGTSDGVLLRCYRHPDREARIRCTRCERLICPDCMREAPVGFQCPECVRAGRVPTRTTVGARTRSDTPVVTWLLIAANIAAFLYEQSSATVQLRFWDYGPAITHNDQYYRLVTSMFLHVSWWHIAMNMYALYLLGPFVERIVGPLRFLGLYFAAGIAGSVLAFTLAYAAPSEGASGAIYGLFAAMWVFGRRSRIDTSRITAVIVLNLVLSFAIPRISWQGHLGGLAAGALIAYVYAYTPPRMWRPIAQAAAVVGVLGLAFAVAVWQAHVLT